ASRAVLLVTTVGFLDADTVAMLAAAAAAAAAAPATPLPHLRRIVLLPGSNTPSDAPRGVDVESWDAFLARASTVAPDVASERRSAVRASDVSDVLFTSGTPGRPKGVVAT